MSIEQMGCVADKTIRLDLDDVTASLLTLCDGILGPGFDFSKVTGVMLTCEDNDCRIAFGRTATISVGHILASGGSLRLPSKDHFNKANVINKTAGQVATLQVTVETA